MFLFDSPFDILFTIISLWSHFSSKFFSPFDFLLLLFILVIVLSIFISLLIAFTHSLFCMFLVSSTLSNILLFLFFYIVQTAHTIIVLYSSSTFFPLSFTTFIDPIAIIDSIDCFFIFTPVPFFHTFLTIFQRLFCPDFSHFISMCSIDSDFPHLQNSFSCHLGMCLKKGPHFILPCIIFHMNSFIFGWSIFSMSFHISCSFMFLFHFSHFIFYSFNMINYYNKVNTSVSTLVRVNNVSSLKH